MCIKPRLLAKREKEYYKAKTEKKYKQKKSERYLFLNGIVFT